MGKSKGKGKPQTKPGGSPYEGRSTTGGEPSPSDQGIIGDLQSLDESKRVNACKMLVGLFESGSAPIENLASEKVLGALSHRIADTSEVVRLEAAGALHNMASTLNSNIGRRMVTSGVFATAIGLIKSIMGNIGADADAALHALMSTEMSRQVVEQLLACIAGVVASHEVDESNSGLLDVHFYGILIKFCRQKSHFDISKITIDLLAVLTDDSTIGCELLCAQNGMDMLKEIMFAMDNNTAVPQSKTSLLQLGAANVILNIFTTLPNAQKECELQVIVKASFSRLEFSEDIKNQLLEQTNNESVGDALEVMKASSEFISNSALISKAPSAEVEAQMTEAERRCCSSSLASEVSQYLQTATPLKYLFDCLLRLAKLLQDMNRKQIPINTHSIYILDTFERLSTAITNILSTSAQALIPLPELPRRLDDLATMAEFLLDGATNTTVFVDDKGKRNTRGLWPVEENTDYQVAMNGFSSSCSIILDIIANTSRLQTLEDTLLKKISTLLCRTIASANYEILSKGVGAAISVSGTEKFPTTLHALLTNSLLRRMSNPTSFRISNGGGLVDTTLITAGVCVEGVIDMHSSDGLDILHHFVKLNALDKLGECYRNVQHDFEEFSSKETEESGEIPHLIEVMENVGPFIEYKRRAINSAGM